MYTYIYNCPKLKCALACADAYNMAMRKCSSADVKSVINVPRLLCALAYIGHNLCMERERKKCYNLISTCNVIHSTGSEVKNQKPKRPQWNSPNRLMVMISGRFILLNVLEIIAEIVMQFGVVRYDTKSST